jgi:hypothetical protein
MPFDLYSLSGWKAFGSRWRSLVYAGTAAKAVAEGELAAGGVQREKCIEVVDIAVEQAPGHSSYCLSDSELFHAAYDHSDSSSAHFGHC